MRKEYGKALRRLFSRRMQDVAPNFERTKINSVYFSPGDRAYRWNISESVYGWIVLSPSQKGFDRFTILIGWSTKARYPELSKVPSDNPTASRTEFQKEECLIRLPKLWTNEDKWWVVREFKPPRSVAELQAMMAPIPDEEAEQQVAPVVEDAINRLVEAGLPYLYEFRDRDASAEG